MKSAKVIWKQLVKGEPIQCGDMWARYDPNTPEKQTEGHDYNLQMQAIHTCYHGKPAYESQHDVGTIWRPVGIAKTETVMA